MCFICVVSHSCLSDTCFTVDAALDEDQHIRCAGAGEETDHKPPTPVRPTPQVQVLPNLWTVPGGE